MHLTIALLLRILIAAFGVLGEFMNSPGGQAAVLGQQPFSQRLLRVAIQLQENGQRLYECFGFRENVLVMGDECLVAWNPSYTCSLKENT